MNTEKIKTITMIKIRHMKDMRLPARASLSYTLASALSKAAGLLFTPIFTRLMTAEEYGGFTLYITVLGVATVVCGSLASASAMYKGYGTFRAEADALTASAFGICALAAIPICMAIIIFRGIIGIPLYFIPFLYLQLVCDGAISAKICEKRYLYSYKEASLITALTSVCTPVLSLILMRIFRGTEARIIGLLLVSTVAAAPTVISALRNRAWNRRLWRFLLGYSLPLFPNALASSIIAEADKLILAAHMGKGALASYAVAHSIGIGLTFITGSLGAALHPWMMRKLRGGEGERCGLVISDACMGLGALTVAVVALSPEALRILTPAAYSVALPAIFPIALSVLPTFMLSMLAVVAVYYDMPRIAGAASLFGAGVNILSNLVLIPRLSYFGAGASLLLAYAFASILCFLLLGRRVALGKIFSPGLILAFGGSLGLSALAAMLYTRLDLRLLLLVFPGAILIRVWRSAREYLGEIKA